MRDAVAVEEGDVAVIEVKLGRRRQGAVGGERLDPQAGMVAGRHHLGDRAAREAAEVEQRAVRPVDHHDAAAIEAARAAPLAAGGVSPTPMKGASGGGDRCRRRRA